MRGAAARRGMACLEGAGAEKKARAGRAYLPLPAARMRDQGLRGCGRGGLAVHTTTWCGNRNRKRPGEAYGSWVLIVLNKNLPPKIPPHSPHLDQGLGSRAGADEVDLRRRSTLTMSLVMTAARSDQLPTSAFDPKGTSELASKSRLDHRWGSSEGTLGEKAGVRVFVGLFTG